MGLNEAGTPSHDLAVKVLLASATPEIAGRRLKRPWSANEPMALHPRFPKSAPALASSARRDLLVLFLLSCPQLSSYRSSDLEELPFPKREASADSNINRASLDPQARQRNSSLRNARPVLDTRAT